MGKKISVIELFGGIGAATQGFARKFGKENVEIVDYVELDKNAVKSYNAINGTNYIPMDIRNKDMSAYPEVDIIIAGWPCQDYSIAGKSLGLEGTRSNLILLTISKIKEMTNKPRYILLENVKGLLSKRHTNDLNYIKELFDELGYNWSQVMLNSKNFGIPQSRGRVFMLLTRKDLPMKKIDHLEKINKIDKTLRDILELNEPTKTVNIKTLLDSDYGKGVKMEYANYMYLPPVNAEKPLNNLEGRRLWKTDEYVGTITTGTRLKIYFKKDSIIHYRKLSTLECWRLMGFSDESHNKAKMAGISNTQLSKQAGNSIVVNVLEAIFEEVFIEEESKGE